MSFLFSGKRLQDWFLVLVAAVLFCSPWFAGFRAIEVPTWHAWVLATVLAYISFAALSESRQWEEWVTLALGAWLVVAPWMLGFSANASARWAHCLTGALVIAISLSAEWSFRHSREIRGGPGSHAR